MHYGNKDAVEVYCCSVQFYNLELLHCSITRLIPVRPLIQTSADCPWIFNMPYRNKVTVQVSCILQH